ncbi:MAG: GIY-YIG nuclease family protein [Chitinophagaceae bacterium]
MAVNIEQALYRYEPGPLSTGFIYILSNAGRSVLYIGVTNDLKRRITEHKEGRGGAFAARYNLKDIMYFEGFPTMVAAIAREKQLKRWHSTWKWNLIKAHNLSLKDLTDDLFGMN